MSEEPPFGYAVPESHEPFLSHPADTASSDSEHPRRPQPWLAAILGLIIGGAIGWPAGLAHRTTTDIGSTPSFGLPAIGGGNAPGAGDIAGKVDPSIVDITSKLDQNATAAGTGMILTASGEILTNNHVINGAETITVTSVTSGQQYSASVVGTDPTQDVAVLRLTHASGLHPINIGDSSKVGVGDPVVALGNAGGVGGTPSVVTGYVTALGQSITASDSNGTNPQRLSGLIETDAPIRPGDSGGPLVNRNAQVIGMDSAASVGGGLGNVASRGFAIPIDHALDIVRQIDSGQGSSTVHIGPRGRIGVEVSALCTGTGATVQVVTKGSPAQKAGISAGDTITELDGTPVTNCTSLGTLVRQHAAGDRVTVTWVTPSGAQHQATVTLAAGPPD